MTYHTIAHLIDSNHVGYYDPQSGLAWAESLTTHTAIALHPVVPTADISTLAATHRLGFGGDQCYCLDTAQSLSEPSVFAWLREHCQCGGHHPE